MLSVILTFLPRQHVSKLNKHGNGNKSPPINTYFFIAGLENTYLFSKIWTSVSSWAHESNRWWAHELISLRECSSTLGTPRLSFNIVMNDKNETVWFEYVEILIHRFVRSCLGILDIISWSLKEEAKHPYFEMFISVLYLKSSNVPFDWNARSIRII